jgi:hypothetical protein
MLFIAAYQMVSTQRQTTFNFSQFILQEAILKLQIYKPSLVSKISGFCGGDYEECHPLGCYAMWLLTFQRNVAPPSSE